MNTLAPGKKIYFASDLHLGLHPIERSREREKLFVRWLDEIAVDAEAIFLLGDVFDYWYEYCKVVPRGFTRTLGKLSELCDRGIQIHFFTGNHDVWVFDYLPSETGVIVHHEPYIMDVNGFRFFLAHGDGLGPGDTGYKLLKAIFHNRVLQWMFSRIHPNGSMAFAHWWSKKSRYSKGISEAFLGEDKEHQVLFARKLLQQEHFDFFVFGHRHVPMDITLNANCRLINLGEWIFANTYAIFDGRQMVLKSFHGPVQP